jgi:hypothetical protein
MRRSLVLVALVGTALGTRTASAAAMHHTDLASLWFLAPVVVEAEEVSHQFEGAEWNETTTYRVTRTWKGDLEPDARIEVFDDTYRLELEPTWDDADPAGPRRVAAPERDTTRVYLFLEPAPARLIEEGRSTREGLWQKVPSGMRIVAGGGVYRFEQWNNPGAYQPVPQGEDPDDALVGTLEANPQPIDPATFEGQLQRAKARAELCATALALENVPLRNTTLLALLPARRTFPPRERPRPGGFPADLLSRRLREEIARSGDVDAYLEAMGRDVVEAWGSFDDRTFVEPDRVGRSEELLAAALDAGRALHQRDAALRVLGNNVNGSLDEEAQRSWLERVGVLLGDPSPWIRAAAVEAVGSWLSLVEAPGKAVARRLLAGALETEDDAEVLNAYAWKLMGQGLKSRLLDPRLRGERRLVLAARPGPADPADGSELVLGYGYVLRDREEQLAMTLVAVATLADGTTIRSASAEAAETTTTTGAGRGLYRFRFEPPLPAGECRVALEASLSLRPGGVAALQATSPALTVAIP